MVRRHSPPFPDARRGRRLSGVELKHGMTTSPEIRTRHCIVSLPIEVYSRRVWSANRSKRDFSHLLEIKARRPVGRCFFGPRR